jgi:hypothetical protein
MTKENEAINGSSTDDVGETTDQGAADTTAQSEQDNNSDASDNVNWQAANDTMKQQREKIKDLEEKMEALPKTPPPETPTPAGLFEGRDKDDYPTYAEIEIALKQKESEFAATLAQVQFQAANPGASEIINKYAKQLDPSLQQAIAQSGSWDAAYKACINSAAYYKDNIAKEKNTAAEKAKENANLPGNASSVGGTGAIGESSKYENMSDAEIIALSDKYKQGGIA